MPKFIKRLDAYEVIWLVLMAVSGAIVGRGLAEISYIEVFFGLVLALNATVQMFLYRQKQAKGAQR